MSEAARELLDEFNDGNWNEVGAYFNDDFQVFLDYLEKNGLEGELDYENVDDEWQNIILLRKLEKYPQETLNYICDNIITDVYYMEGGYYLYLREREELAILFSNSGRDFSSRDAAEKVLSEDFWDPYWDTTDDVYSDSDNNSPTVYCVYTKDYGNRQVKLSGKMIDGVFNENATIIEQLANIRLLLVKRKV